MCLSVTPWASFRIFIRRVLYLTCLRYVDDYFGSEQEQLVEHAKLCFARLLRALLGPCAASERKLLHGNPLDILGVTVNIKNDAAIFFPSMDKV